MNASEALSRVYFKVKTCGTIIPRNYQTIGGMWTRDTWEYKNLRAYCEDEGYTNGVQAYVDGKLVLDVSETYNQGLMVRHADGDRDLLLAALINTAESWKE